MPSLIGSNVARLGELLAGPLLVGMASARHRWLLAIALGGAAVWQVAQPIADLGQGNAPAYAPQTAALVGELRALHADTARVEAVPQYGHWESQELASVVPLARGWERQLDIERNPIFYGGVLTPAAYYSWLQYNAVRYVAISTVTPDPAGVAEAATVREGQPWLVLVWHNAFWRLYRVTGTYPMASPPAVVTEHYARADHAPHGPGGDDHRPGPLVAATAGAWRVCEPGRAVDARDGQSAGQLRAPGPLLTCLARSGQRGVMTTTGIFLAVFVWYRR